MEYDPDKEIWDVESIGLQTQYSDLSNRPGCKFDAAKVIRGEIKNEDAPIAALQSIGIENNEDQMSDLNSYQSQLSEDKNRNNNEADMIEDNRTEKKKQCEALPSINIDVRSPQAVQINLNVNTEYEVIVNHNGRVMRFESSTLSKENKKE